MEEPGKEAPDRILMEGPMSPATLEQLSISGSLDNFRPAERQKAALVEIAGLNPGLVFVARRDQEIVGYVAFHRPDPYSRWLSHTRTLELGAVEVSRDCRRQGVASRLLDAAFAFPLMKGYIVITLEYHWHWDLAGSGLDAEQYRRMLMRLYGGVGMVEKNTDDPDIAEHPANLMMARVGAHVSLVDELAFGEMLFRRESLSGKVRHG